MKGMVIVDKYKYTNNVVLALIDNAYKNEGIGYLYEGKNGALRLAREYGYGLRSLGVKYQDEIIEESYITLCYRYYQCKPPIKLNEWCSEIYKW